MQAAVAKTLDRFGQLDALIANAGFGGRGPLIDGDITRWKDMIDTNVYGLLLTLKFGVPALLERGGGNVVVTSSVAGGRADARRRRLLWLQKPQPPP